MFFTSRPKLNMGMVIETPVNSRTPTTLTNRYIPGSGVGASSISSRRAKSLRSEVRYFSNNVSITPRNVRATLTNMGASVMVTWDNPEAIGITKNSRIASYTITATPDTQGIEPRSITVPSLKNSITIDELLFGKPYRFVVAATNYGGDSENAITSESISTYTVPGAPSNLVPTIGDRKVSILFDVPADNGNSIIGYCVYIDGARVPDSDLRMVDVSVPGKVQLNIGNLINGIQYSICITAKNKAGEGLQSESIGATPLSVPDVPTELSAIAGDATCDIYFTAPVSDGGSHVTCYFASSGHIGLSTSGLTVVESSTPPKMKITVPHLVNGNIYNIALRPYNALGEGDYSEPVTVIPYTVPDIPIDLTAIAGDGDAVISFTAPFNGGSNITSYAYSINDGVNFTIVSDLAIPFTIPNLTNGMTYNIIVKAINIAGESSNSASVLVTPNPVTK